MTRASGEEGDKESKMKCPKCGTEMNCDHIGGVCICPYCEYIVEE